MKQIEKKCGLPDWDNKEMGKAAKRYPEGRNLNQIRHKREKLKPSEARKELIAKFQI